MARGQSAPWRRPDGVDHGHPTWRFDGWASRRNRCVAGVMVVEAIRLIGEGESAGGRGQGAPDRSGTGDARLRWPCRNRSDLTTSASTQTGAVRPAAPWRHGSTRTWRRTHVARRRRFGFDTCGCRFHGRSASLPSRREDQVLCGNLGGSSTPAVHNLVSDRMPLTRRLDQPGTVYRETLWSRPVLGRPPAVEAASGTRSIRGCRHSTTRIDRSGVVVKRFWGSIARWTRCGARRGPSP